MRKRFMVSIACGAVGLAASIPVADRFSLEPYQAIIGCTAVGLFIGYLLSIFLDVFLSNSTSPEN